MKNPRKKPKTERPPAKTPAVTPLDKAMDRATGSRTSTGTPEAPTPLDRAIEHATGESQPAEQHPAEELHRIFSPVEEPDEPWSEDGNGLVCGSASQTTGIACVPARKIATAPPQTVEEKLHGLPRWQAAYVLALMEVHGVVALACLRCKVSRQSIEEHQAASPAFSAACGAAVDHSTDLLEAAGMRGATIGDLQPIYQQGVLVGYKRVRSSKDLEIMLKLRGRLKDESQLNVNHAGRVEIAQESVVPGLLVEAARLLFGGGRKPTLDA